MDKDQTIFELLDWLKQRLGNTFAVTGHWEADLFAIGLSALDDPAQLVYLRTLGLPAGHVTVELESAPPIGSVMPYRTVGEFNSALREEVLPTIVQHLGIGSARK